MASWFVPPIVVLFMLAALIVGWGLNRTICEWPLMAAVRAGFFPTETGQVPHANARLFPTKRLLWT
jgi:hypothetical protein